MKAAFGQKLEARAALKVRHLIQCFVPPESQPTFQPFARCALTPRNDNSGLHDGPFKLALICIDV